jgi:hypothetical protein
MVVLKRGSIPVYYHKSFNIGANISLQLEGNKVKTVKQDKVGVKSLLLDKVQYLWYHALTDSVEFSLAKDLLLLIQSLFVVIFVINLKAFETFKQKLKVNKFA